MKSFHVLLVISTLLLFGCSPNDNPTAPSETIHHSITSLALTQAQDPPVVTLAASTNEIFSAHNKMVTVIFSGTLVNYTSASYTLTDEYGKISYSGSLSGTTFSISLDLKAQCHGNDKDGRTYTFTVTAVGSSTVSASATVVVLRDNKKNGHDGGDDDNGDDND